VIAPPGSTLWLMRHELRLLWRGMAARRGRGTGRFRMLWIAAILPVILLVTAGLPLSYALRKVEIPIAPISVAIGAVVSLAIFTLMLSQTLSAAVDALYERADLDLLFSSPMNPRRVLTVRFLAVALNIFALFFLLTAPILLPTAVLSHPAWLALEVVLFAIALAAAGAGLLIAWGLFRVIGPRRTRTVGQVLAAVTGAAAFLTGQAYNILGRGKSASVWMEVVRWVGESRVKSLPGLDWPLRAMLGQPGPLLGVVAAGAGIFLAANQVLGPRFAADAAAAAGVGTGGTRKVRAATRARFSTSTFIATFTKELRLIARDPALISQVLLRVLYILPLGFVLLRQAGAAQTYALPGGAGALSMIAGQITGSLAWITISAEDAPDLLSCSPAPIRTLRRAKLAAAILPVAAPLLFVLVPLTFMAPRVGMAASLGCAAAMGMTGALNVWWQRPGKRSEFRRARQASWFVTLAELLLGLVIAVATAVLAAGLVLWALIPAGLALGGVLLLRRSDEQVAQALRAAS
jgi:ABC-2 type transport system permease protein